jgi:non-ribosomal peptide synthetase component F
MTYESVQGMFARIAAEFGPQLAIERGEQTVTYSELALQSNRLANLLLA